MMKLFAAALAVTFLPASAAFGAETAAGLPLYMRLELWIAGVGVTGLGYFAREVCKFAVSMIRPWISSKLSQLKYYHILSAGYGIMERNYHAHTLRMKEEDKEGKLDQKQIAYLRQKFRNELLSDLAAAGITELKEYGPQFIDDLCEYLLAKVKNDTARAALLPLSDLASAPLPESPSVPPAVTAEDFGSTTAGAVPKSVSAM